MPTEIRWQVTSPSPLQLTVVDDGGGEAVKSVSRDHDPVRVRKDRRFQRARRNGNLAKVAVDVPTDEPEGGSEPETDGDEAESDASGATPIGELGLSARIVDVYRAAGIESVEALLDHGLDRLVDIEGIGDERAEDTVEALEAAGFA